MGKLHFPAALALTILAGAPCSSQVLQSTPSAGTESATQSSPRLAGTIRATLEKHVELKKLKVGDEVDIRLTQDMKVGGKTMAPKNSRVAGHVAELMSLERGDPISRLAIVFDRILKKDGGDLPIYGIVSGVILPQSDNEENLSDLQAARLEVMRTEVMNGEAHGETIDAINELYRTSRTNLPSSASQQWNCERTVGEWLYCSPVNHFLVGRPRGIPGMKDVILQFEKTPQGMLGVLVSAQKNITLNGGIDLLVRLMPKS